VLLANRTCPDFANNILPHHFHDSDCPPSPHHAPNIPSDSPSTMSERDSFLHLARPLGPAPVGAQPSTAPLNVAIQPQVRAYTVADIGLQALT
jgi:hypothetical protein